MQRRGCSSQTLAAVGLGPDVPSLMVLHIGFTPLAVLPERFLVRLRSSRERFGTGYSSAFASHYELRGDLKARQMVMEPWRPVVRDPRCEPPGVRSTFSLSSLLFLSSSLLLFGEKKCRWRDVKCRKNDHDVFFYDIGECRMKAITSHWMSGSTETTQALPW